MQHTMRYNVKRIQIASCVRSATVFSESHRTLISFPLPISIVLSLSVRRRMCVLTIQMRCLFLVNR